MVAGAAAALLGDAIRAARARLAAAGVPSPEFDALELAAWTVGVPRAKLDRSVRLGPHQAAAFEAAVSRRSRREPLQHIVGTAAFRHVSVLVGPGVFIPRPETEVVAGWAIDRAAEVAATGRRPLVVDLCTGSAAIALAVVDEVPAARVHAVDIAPAAFAWAERNTADTPVHLHLGDAATALPELDGQVDVVVSNPPYIPADGLVRDPEVLQHDPPTALWGHGPDGLQVLRSVAARAAGLLRPGGWFVVEHADVQAAGVAAALAAMRDPVDGAVWAQLGSHRDLSGRDRFATARRATRATPG